MTIEDTVYKLKEKYLKQTYGVKINSKYDDIEDVIIKSDLIINHKDGRQLNQDDWVVFEKDDYIKRINAERYIGKLELLNEIFEANPDACCISGCKTEEK